MTTIRIDAERYRGCEDRLAAAAEDARKGLIEGGRFTCDGYPNAAGWDLSPRWEDDTRRIILLDVPL